MMDIYGFMNRYLLDNNYNELNINLKKELIERGLKEYTISKINAFCKDGYLSIDDNMSLSDLIAILAGFIPKEQHFNTIRHYTHAILNIAGNLQGFSITWISDVNDPIEEPIAKFNENGLWYELETHNTPDQVITFNFVYDVFKNNFMNMEKGSAYQLKPSDKKG